MNNRFFSLPTDKQNRIINAGYRIFSENSYKKSPMSEISAEAGISKSLLFFYFKNKKELFLFLWEKAAETTLKYLTEYHCYEPTDLFEMMERGMNAKFKLMEEYPYMSFFAVKAFYEKDADICAEIQDSYRKWFDIKAISAISRLSPDSFIPGLDLSMMYREMYWASEGYLWEMLQQGSLNIPRMKEDFQKLLAFWKSVYLKKSDD